MVSTQHILKQLQDGPGVREREILAIDGDLQVRVKLSDWDRLGCLVERIEMKSSTGHELNLDPGRIEKEVTYLGEPLRQIELEQSSGRAIIRSYPPRMENGRVSFFEVAVGPSEGVSLKRLCYDRLRGDRSEVPACFTREVLERLISDLVSFIREN